MTLNEPKEIKTVSKDTYNYFLKNSYQINAPIWNGGDCAVSILDKRIQAGIKAVKIKANPFNGNLYVWDTNTPKYSEIISGFPATKFFIKDLILIYYSDSRKKENTTIQKQTNTDKGYKKENKSLNEVDKKAISYLTEKLKQYHFNNDAMKRFQKFIQIEINLIKGQKKLF